MTAVCWIGDAVQALQEHGAEPEPEVHAEVLGPRLRAQSEPRQDGRQGRVHRARRQLVRQQGRVGRTQRRTYVYHSTGVLSHYLPSPAVLLSYTGP